jgi:hypothetical protein
MLIVRLGTLVVLVCLAGCGRESAIDVSSVLPQSPPVHRAADREPDADLESGERVAPAFREVAQDLGLNFQFENHAIPKRFFLPEVMGGGIAWIDFDGDGRLDLYAVNGCRLEPGETRSGSGHRLFRNLNGTRFVDVTDESDARVVAYGQGVAVGDFDCDGFSDLFLSNYGSSVLLRNNGDGTLKDMTSSSGAAIEGWGSSAVWFDADDDGYTDLYVTKYMDVTFENHKICQIAEVDGYCGPGGFSAVPDVVFRNLGDGTFRDDTLELGFVDDGGKGLVVVAADFDDDRRAEIYVGNDMTPNHLFTRSTTLDVSSKPRRMYENVAMTAGCAVSNDGLNEASMGVSVADFDGDGRPDIFLTHYYHMKNTLYLNRGGLIFDDESRQTKVAAISFESLGFGTVPLDFDRDGDPDLFIANGHVLGPDSSPSAMRPQFVRNNSGQFEDISHASGAYFRELMLGRGVAGGDFDNDGDIDICVSHLDRPLALLRNDTQTKRQFIGLEVKTPFRVPPVGGKVMVSRGAWREVRTMISGGSYLSASDTRMVFGLPQGEGPIAVEIAWPSGRIDRFEGLDPDRYWFVLEGRSPHLTVVDRT